MKRLLKFFKEEDGATALEYGLMAAGITVAIIVAVLALGGTLRGIFENVDEQLQTVPN